MKNENIDHLELRIHLGSIVYSPNKVSNNIKQELFIIYEFVKEKKISLKIIPQISKVKDKQEIETYFNIIIDILNKYPQLNSIISGFDIAGNENDGKPLIYFKNIIENINNKNISIPWILHIGEIINLKSLNNLKFCINYKIKRIGHGIAFILDNNVKEHLIENNIILEFCPISNKYHHNLTDKLIFEIINSGILLCIGSDDTNKLFDTDLNDNFKILKKYDKSNILECQFILNGIIAAHCNFSIKKIMFNKLKKDYKILNNFKEIETVECFYKISKKLFKMYKFLNVN